VQDEHEEAEASVIVFCFKKVSTMGNHTVLFSITFKEFHYHDKVLIKIKGNSTFEEKGRKELEKKFLIKHIFF
jgi:quercetin dioxygenase-like cupin family protein